jgi:hypothetical protein
MKSIRITDYGMTFIYPATFVSPNPKVVAPATYTLPAAELRGKNPPCAQAPLSVGSPNTPGKPVFVLSIIDDACPAVLKQTQQLSTFTRDQLLRQLARYGLPTLTKESRTFTLDGRPSVVALGTATPDASHPDTALPPHPSSAASASSPTTTYAAKICTFAHIPTDTGGHFLHQTSSPTPILCFDFTTQQSSVLDELLALPIQFGDDAPRSLVPAAILR